jgi:hypothetical protein
LLNNRNNAYAQPLIYKELASGLPNFDTRQCSSGASATLDPETVKSPDFQARVKVTEKPADKQATPGEKQTKEEAAQGFLDLLKKYALAGGETTNAPAPGCGLQAPFEPIFGSGPPTSYQQTFQQGK